MNKQTAVEWLFAHLLPFLPFSDAKEREHFRKCLEEAKAMEREQIMMAVKDSWYMAKGSNFQERKKNNTTTQHTKEVQMSKTAMQDLREDLLESILKVNSRLDFLDNITDENVRNLCKTMVDTTLKGIVKRIDDELLDMEREQIIEAYRYSRAHWSREDGNPEQYYNKIYKGGEQ